MNKLTPSLLPLPLAVLAAFALLSNVQAQETTTTTTVTTTVPAATPVQPATVEVQTVQPAPTVAPVPGQHVVEIELAVTKGSVQAYFGHAAGRENVHIGSAELSFKLPSTATVTKITSRDDDSSGSHKVTPDNPWHVTVPFNGGGRYVFNIQDWSDDPVVAAVVKVDGVVMFAGRGSEDDLNGWAQKSYGPGVRKTGSREIAFIIPAE